MSTADVLLLNGESEPVPEEKPDYRIAQQRLNALGREARQGVLVMPSLRIRAEGLELRRTPRGTLLIQVRKPLP